MEKEPVLVRAYMAHEIDPASTLTGNGKDYVLVKTGDVDGEVAWEGLSVPYRIVSNNSASHTINVNRDESLLLEDGATLLFDSDTGLKVYDGYLRANGTATEKIVLQGLTPTPGAWRGILVDSDNVNNVLDHVEIAHAGGGSFNSNGDIGSVIVWADSYLALTNSVVRDGSGCGINATYNGETLVTTGTTFTNVSPDICQ